MDLSIDTSRTELLPPFFHAEVRQEAKQKLGLLKKEVDDFSSQVDFNKRALQGIHANNDDPWAVGANVLQHFETFIKGLSKMTESYKNTVQDFFNRKRQILNRILEIYTSLQNAFHDYVGNLDSNIDNVHWMLKKLLKKDEVNPNSIGDSARQAFSKLMSSSVGSAHGRNNTFALYADRLTSSLHQSMAEEKEINIAEYFTKRHDKWSPYFEYSKNPNLKLELEPNLGNFKIKKRAFSFMIDYAIWYLLQKSYDKKDDTRTIDLKISRDREHGRDDLRIELVCHQIDPIKRLEVSEVSDPLTPPGPEVLLFPNPTYKETNVNNLAELCNGTMETPSDLQNGSRIIITIPNII